MEVDDVSEEEEGGDVADSDEYEEMSDVDLDVNDVSEEEEGCGVADSGEYKEESEVDEVCTVAIVCVLCIVLNCAV